jgi:uncharacterized protein VirK/YbjX
MDWELLKQIGRKVYKCEDWKDYKRYYVFLARCRVHQDALAKHLAFFAATPERKAIMNGCPWFIDQATRQVFYKDSTFGERSYYVQRHIEYMELLFKPEVLDTLYVKGHRILLWQDTFEEKPLSLYLVFRDGQQKEGCLSIELVYDNTDLEHTGWDAGTHVYQIMFTLADKSITGDGNVKTQIAEAVKKPALPENLAITIGALQGLAGGEQLIKKLTKAYFGYRPKNLIMWCLRCLAEAIGAQRIVTVSNAGYYAMNHLRMDRKLKVDLDRFWEECEGKLLPDKRFYELPISEYRKDMSELKPSKRAQHRRRFEKMDAIKAEITANLHQLMK